jgi:uncharacterized protein with ParB-like and HNH nuclease domain
MKADSTSLLELVSRTNTLFDIPVYQRKYEWSQDQCEKLFNDLVSLIKNPNENHFLGTIVYITEKKDDNSCNIHQVIDGQQRLTSCMLLLRAIATCSDNPLLTEQILDQYLTNKYMNENDNLKLRSIESDYQSFVAIMKNRSTRLMEPSKMITNYKYFIDKIYESNISPKEYSDAFNRMRMVYIELEAGNTDENPQIIFESINSTGISLLPTDLIRNFLLMGVESEEQSLLYSQYWAKIQSMFTNDVITEFIRHYLIYKNRRSIKKDDVYEEYKKFFWKEKYTPRYALSELYEFALFYQQLRLANFEDARLRITIDNINTMDRKAIYPYLLKLLKLNSQEKLSLTELVKITEVLNSYLYRSLICEKSSNAIGVLAIALSKEIHDLSEIEFLEEKLLNKGFPDNTEFKEAFIKLDIYKKRNNLAKITLLMLEYYLTNKKYNIENIKIEKVLPQKPNNDWGISINDVQDINSKYGDTIGNLTLISEEENIEESNFDVKREAYKTSEYQLTHMIPKTYNNWNKNSLENRSELLSEQAVQIWFMPNQKKYVQRKNLSGEHYLDEDLIVKGEKPTKLIIKEKSFTVKSWKALLIKLLDYVWDYNSADFELLKKDFSIHNTLFKSPADINAPGALSNGELVETNFSATTILALISKVADIYNISDEISYILK